MRNALLIMMYLAAVAIPGQASATPFTITSGLFGFDSESDFFTFIGDDFQIRSNDHILLISRKLFTPRCDLCRVGELVDWSFETPGDQRLGVGDATMDGVTFSGVEFFGHMKFDVVPTPFPDGPDPTNRIFIAPFSFSADMRFVRDGGELFSTSLVGGGDFQLYYNSVPSAGAFATFDETPIYTFKPALVPAPPAVEAVPEPSAFIVLALSGLGVAGWERIRRRRSSSENSPRFSEVPW